MDDNSVRGAHAWLCPHCLATVDISAPRSRYVHVCACRPAGVDWDRAAGMLRVVMATGGRAGSAAVGVVDARIDEGLPVRDAPMIKDMRVLALKAERMAQSGSSASVRERARGRGDAACWWYARHVELLIGRPEVVQVFQQEAAAIATAEEARGCRERAEGRRGVDAWVLQGFARRWQDAERLSPVETGSPRVG